MVCGVQQDDHIIELTDEDLSTVAAGMLTQFLKFGDIQGESTSKDHKDWVQLMEYDYDMTGSGQQNGLVVRPAAPNALTIPSGLFGSLRLQ